MTQRYYLTAGLVLAAFGAQAQCVIGTVSPTNLQVTTITATTATVTFQGGSNGGILGNPACATRISYAYAGGSPVSVPYAMPLLLTGLPPGTAITVTVVRYVINQLAAGPHCCSLAAARTFTTAGAPLAAAAPTKAGLLTLAPNPARTRVILTLAAPLPAPAVAQVLDAVGREVRQQALPAHAPTAALDLAGLAPGFYLVRAGGAAARLLVE